jgi:Flp pilus assembly protein TadG
MVRFRRFCRSLSRRQDGAVAVEFAFIGPILIVLLLGIAGWGGFFWISHAVQQVANDAARAAISGLDTAERQQVANSVLATEIDDYAWLSMSAATVSVQTVQQTVTVKVTYDASQTPFWIMKGIVPLPSSTIVRSATVRLGGY